MAEISEERKLELWRFAACGSHSNRYGEEDSVWDSTCIKCATRFDLLKRFELDHLRSAPAQPQLDSLEADYERKAPIARHMTETALDFEGEIDYIDKLRSAPDPRDAQIGNYSCASCGFGMKEPCVHWLKLALGEKDAQIAALREMVKRLYTYKPGMDEEVERLLSSTAPAAEAFRLSVAWCRRRSKAKGKKEVGE